MACHQFCFKGAELKHAQGTIEALQQETNLLKDQHATEINRLYDMWHIERKEHVKWNTAHREDVAARKQETQDFKDQLAVKDEDIEQLKDSVAAKDQKMKTFREEVQAQIEATMDKLNAARNTGLEEKKWFQGQISTLEQEMAHKDSALDYVRRQYSNLDHSFHVLNMENEQKVKKLQEKLCAYEAESQDDTMEVQLATLTQAFDDVCMKLEAKMQTSHDSEDVQEILGQNIDLEDRLEAYEVSYKQLQLELRQNQIESQKNVEKAEEKATFYKDQLNTVTINYEKRMKMFLEERQDFEKQRYMAQEKLEEELWKRNIEATLLSQDLEEAQKEVQKLMVKHQAAEIQIKNFEEEASNDYKQQVEMQKFQIVDLENQLEAVQKEAKNQLVRQKAAEEKWANEASIRIAELEEKCAAEARKAAEAVAETQKLKKTKEEAAERRRTQLQCIKELAKRYEI
ncbi:hypothetical protein L596_021840 [Steinernema carpocapsae]|uniref:Uncharacterized protein n=1 Tax=Steinernema carpocapsae TaxID=34508 RepID=A0A4U5MKA7_STECR|nr:hypothetical protein L596_021840 [Steinernema carpocapsae]